MNYTEKEHLLKSLNAGYRFDGRALEDWRSLEVETNLISTSEGSARVKLGNTELIAGVKLSIGSPFPDRPKEGVLMVGCELLPMSHESIESGPPSIDAIEISRVIDRGIRESKSVDVENLCIVPGEKVWIVSVDIVPLNHDGNIIDAGAIAALVALKNTKFPEIVNGVVDYKHLSDKKLIVEKEPIAVTVGKIGDHLIIDPTKDEEDVLDARLTCTIGQDGKFCSLQKGGETPFTIDEIDQIFELAMVKSEEIRKQL